MDERIDQAAREITAHVMAAGSPERAAREQAYLKSTLEFSGTPVPLIRRIVTSWRRAHPDLVGPELAALAAELWDGKVFECRTATVILLSDQRALLQPSDAVLVERFLRTSETWALVDGLAADVMGSMVTRFPELLTTLDRWAADDEFWIRRSALLALLGPLRRGDTAHFQRFARYADSMLDDREFFIRKAIGWVLRETGKRHPDLVTEWLKPRAARTSGITVREAVKWLPAEQRETLLLAHQAERAST